MIYLARTLTEFRKKLPRTLFSGRRIPCSTGKEHPSRSVAHARVPASKTRNPGDFPVQTCLTWSRSTDPAANGFWVAWNRARAGRQGCAIALLTPVKSVESELGGLPMPGGPSACFRCLAWRDSRHLRQTSDNRRWAL